MKTDPDSVFQLDTAAIDPNALYMSSAGVTRGEDLEPLSRDELQRRDEQERARAAAEWDRQEWDRFFGRFGREEHRRWDAFGRFLQSEGLVLHEIRGHVWALRRVETFFEGRRAETLEVGDWKRYLTDGPHAEKTKRYTLRVGHALHRWGAATGADWTSENVLELTFDQVVA